MQRERILIFDVISNRFCDVSRVAFHQLVVNQLIWIWPNAEVTAKWTVQRQDHENNQTNEDRQQQHLNHVQPHIVNFEEEGSAQANECANDDHGPHYRWQSCANRIKSQAARLDQLVIGTQRFGMQDFLPFGRWFELRQHRLEVAHVLEPAFWKLSSLLQWPDLMNNIIGVFAKSRLKLCANRFRIAGHVAVKLVQCGGLSGHDLCRVGIRLENGHGNQRYCESIENHYRLQHRARELRICSLNAQTRYHVAADQQQATHGVQA